MCLLIDFNKSGSVTNYRSLPPTDPIPFLLEGRKVAPHWELPKEEILNAKISTLANNLFQNAPPKLQIRSFSARNNHFILTYSPIYTTDELLEHYTPAPARRHLSIEQKTTIREYLRRVNKQELKSALALTTQLPPLSQKELSALKNRNWGHSLFRSPNLVLYALRAFISGTLTPFEISDILLFIECTRHNQSHTVQLFTPLGQIDRETLPLLQLALKTSDGLHDTIKSYYTTEEIYKFLSSLSPLPPHNTQGYLVPTTVTDDESSIIPTLLKNCHKFLIVQTPKQTYQLVLPPHLLVPLLQAKFGPSTMQPNLVLGESVAAKNFFSPHQRDLLIPCRLFPRSTPTEADSYSASPIEFYYHDASYHLPIESSNLHRAAWIELAAHFTPKALKKLTQNPYLPREMYKVLLDRDFPNYLYSFVHDTPQEEGQSWAFQQALDFMKERFNTIEPELGNKLYTEIMNYIVANAARWDTTYNIHPEVTNVTSNSSIAPNTASTDNVDKQSLNLLPPHPS